MEREQGRAGKGRADQVSEDGAEAVLQVVEALRVLSAQLRPEQQQVSVLLPRPRPYRVPTWRAQKTHTQTDRQQCIVSESEKEGTHRMKGREDEGEERRG